MTSTNGAKGRRQIADKAGFRVPDAPPNDGKGQEARAGKASEHVPDPSPLSTNGAKGRAESAGKANAFVPDAPPNDGKGHRRNAAKAREIVPDPSPPISRADRAALAAKAKQQLSASADPNDGAKGQVGVADKAKAEVPSSPSPHSRAGQEGSAGKAIDRVPVSADPNDGAKGQQLPADKARSHVPSSPSPHSRAGHPETAAKAIPEAPVSAVLAQLYELQVRRKFYISIVNKQTNAAKALVRRALGWRYDSDEGDRAKLNAKAARIVGAAIAGKEQRPEDIAAFTALQVDLAVIAKAMLPCTEARHAVELDMQRIVRRLPVYAWAKEVKGLGEKGLAVILGEAGDLSNYPTKGHLWKRLGLAPYEGKAYSTWRREGGLSADEWTSAGYSPRRRAEVFAVISEPLLKTQLIGKAKSETKHGLAKGPYGAIYVRRREHLDEAHPDWTPKHCQMDALRVMTKTLLRDLLREWKRKATDQLPERVKAGLPSGEADRQTAFPALPERATGHVPSARAAEASVNVPERAKRDLPSGGAAGAEATVGVPDKASRPVPPHLPSETVP